MTEIIIMFFLTIAQNASFTLVSRARNSKSLLYHGLAAIGSNGIWLLVFRHLSLNLSNNSLMATYVVGAVTGSLLMHWFAMKFLEKPRQPKVFESLSADEVLWIKERYKSSTCSRLGDVSDSYKLTQCQKPST